MRPSFLDDMSWAMAEVYGSVTDRLLVNLARHFPYIKNADQIRGSFDYQARLLAQMGQVNRESVDIIMQSLGGAGPSGGADAALRASLEAAIMDALKGEEPKLRKAAQQGLLNGSGAGGTDIVRRDGGAEDQIQLGRGDAALLEGPLGRLRRQGGRGLGHGDPPFPHADPGGDPLVGGLYHSGEIVVGQDFCGSRAARAEKPKAHGCPPQNVVI